jgi:uncharacterized protein YbaP (TraB family)
LNPAREAFLASYTAEKTKNQFTKVQMNYDADQVLQEYFRKNESRIQNWFNVIAPRKQPLEQLQSEIATLRNKDWREIHSI